MIMLLNCFFQCRHSFAFLLIVLITGCSSAEIVYTTYPEKHIESVRSLFSTFTGFVSDTEEIPDNPRQVMSRYQDRIFYSYIDVELSHGRIVNPSRLSFFKRKADLANPEGLSAELVYLRIYTLDKNNQNKYLGFTILNITVMGVFAYPAWKPYPPVDCVDWERFVNYENTDAIPADIMSPDGKPDPVIIRMDYIENMPYNDLENVFWEWS